MLKPQASLKTNFFDFSAVIDIGGIHQVVDGIIVGEKRIVKWCIGKGIVGGYIGVPALFVGGFNSKFNFSTVVDGVGKIRLKSEQLIVPLYIIVLKAGRINRHLARKGVRRK